MPMLQIEAKDWVLLYGGSIIAILFGFLASLTVELFLRAQELKLGIKQMELKNDEAKLQREFSSELNDTKNLLLKIRWGFGIFLVAILAYIIIAFIFGSSSQPLTNNVSTVCENCNYPTNITNINNYYNITEVKNPNNDVSVKELKFFFSKRSHDGYPSKF
jgi:hypothetical protein